MPAARPITGIDISTGAPYSALAWGDGVNDDTAVLQAALNACGLIFVPSGTYKVSSPLLIPAIDGAGIVGSGAAVKFLQLTDAGTVFMSSSPTGNIITCPNGLTHARFQGFALDRSVVCTQGYGLDMSVIGDSASVVDVRSERSNIGFRFGTTGWAEASYCFANHNVLDGFEIVGQWQLEKMLSQNNGRDGFSVSGLLAPGNSMGQWTGLSSYANGGNGIGFYGAVNPVHGIRLSDSFFGGDGGYGVFCDSHSSVPSVFTNVYVEQEPLSGFYFTVNAGRVSLSNCASITNIQHGLVSEAPLCQISGGNFSQNQASGVFYNAGQGSVIGAELAFNGGYGLVTSAGVVGMTWIADCFTANGLGPTSVAATVPAAFGNF